MTPDLVSGIATSTTAGIELVEQLRGIKALSLSERESIPQLIYILKEKLPGEFFPLMREEELVGD
ncbi:MAG: hypothetical protein AB4038_16010 [Prochloraceae cyanobacterium]